MRSRPHIDVRRVSRIRVSFVLILIGALFFGLIADGLHAHEGEPAGLETQIVQVTDANSSVHVILDADCGIHPGCAAALIPNGLVSAVVSNRSTRMVMSWRQSASFADVEFIHVPILF